MKHHSLIKTILIMATIFALLGCSSEKTLPTVKQVDLEKYKGTWYEIARLPNSFEKGLDCTTANYKLKEDGKIAVLNRGRKVETGKWKDAKGTARIPDKNKPGQLKVSFFWPFAGDYYIMELDKDYQHVLVGSPSREYLWILARNKSMQPEVYNQLVEIAKNQDFDISRLEKINQDCE